MVASGELKDDTFTIPLTKDVSEKFSVIIKQNKARPKSTKVKK